MTFYYFNAYSDEKLNKICDFFKPSLINMLSEWFDSSDITISIENYAGKFENSFAKYSVNNSILAFDERKLLKSIFNEIPVSIISNEYSVLITYFSKKIFSVLNKDRKSKTEDFIPANNPTLPRVNTGFVLINILINEVVLSILIEPDIIADILGSHVNNNKHNQRSLVTIFNALPDINVAVQAHVGEAKLTLSDFIGLNSGDVIKFTLPYDEPVILYINNKNTEIKGHLGRNNDSLAIKLY